MYSSCTIRGCVTTYSSGRIFLGNWVDMLICIFLCHQTAFGLLANLQVDDGSCQETFSCKTETLIFYIREGYNLGESLVVLVRLHVFTHLSFLVLPHSVVFNATAVMFNADEMRRRSRTERPFLSSQTILANSKRISSGNNKGFGNSNPCPSLNCISIYVGSS